MMEKYLLDANVIISGLLWEGNESKLLELVERGRIKMVGMIYILDEVRRVLINDFGYDENKGSMLAGWIEGMASELVGASREECAGYEGHLRDQEDLPILAGAVKSGSILVTGDKRLVEDAKRFVKVLSASELLGMVSEGRS
jgi:putative PIN family toxin of toxin-antitoxin system